MTENKRGKEEEEIIIHYEFLKLLSEKRLASLLSNNLLKHRWVRIKRKTTHLKIWNFQMSFMRSWQAPIFWLAIFTFFFHVFPPNGQVICSGEGGPISGEAGLSVINHACREIWHDSSVPIHDSCNFCYKFLNKSLFR